ncbi:MAG TPA: hypothetical protein VKC60_13450, partial [Opitutaceae bacterium]|nr:hypothetical protein [Opitutaceae bacterium]
SVGWLGAVAAFLVLSIAGLTSQNAKTVHGAYLAMNLIGEFIIVPLSLAALATGLIQALGTDWGLFQYYWVLVKFVLTIGATILLLLHQFTAVAEAEKLVSGVTDGTLPSAGRLGLQLVVDASLAILVLLVVTTLSVFKPWGRIDYQRRLMEQDGQDTSHETHLSAQPTRPYSREIADGRSFRLKIFLAGIGLILVVFIALHFIGGGFRHH